MGMFKNLLRSLESQTNTNADLSEVYTYANSVGVTPQQVDAAISDNTALRERLIAWKYLIHSLVNTGYTPWIKGDGAAYFVTSITPNINSYAEVVMKMVSNDNDVKLVLGTRVNTNPEYRYTRYTLCAYNSRIRLDWTSHNYAEYYVVDLTQKTKVKLSSTHLYINDNLVIDTTSETTPPQYPFAVFTSNNSNGATTSFVYNGYFNRVIITGNVAPNTAGSVNLVPYCHNGVCGMLDLNSDTFYSSAVPNGMFSYELRDENNVQVNINN